VYRNCIFCSSDLGTNESIEEFPVGRSLAFDGWKGRLWAVCPACHRWNLAPIEERWEAVERAEELFRQTPLRAQSENVGMARLPGGVRLVRVGDALPGELAAWRYGRELRSRRVRYWRHVALAIVAGLAGGTIGRPGYYLRKRVAYRIGADTSPTGKPLPIRWRDLHGAEFRSTIAGPELSVRLQHRGLIRRVPAVELLGPPARTLLERTLIGVNHTGASRDLLEAALRELSAAPAVERLIAGDHFASFGLDPGADILRVRESWRKGTWWLEAKRHGKAPARLAPPRALALEMALHEASERRALAGELVELEARWREAEEIARIADSL
jgi:hypothetical protein